VGSYNPETREWIAVRTPTPNSRPHGLTVGAGGHVFYTAQSANLIGRYDPAQKRVVNEYPVMTDPHTPFFLNGIVWFTSQRGNRYGRLDPSNGSVMLWPSPTSSSQPYGIDVAPSGRLWIALFGTNKLLELDPANPGMPREHVLPNATSRPRRLAVDKEGRVWFTDYSRDKLGMFNPAMNQFREWDSPSAMGRTYGIVVGPDGRIWYNDDGASLMAAFDLATERTEAVPIPTRGSVVRNISADPMRRRIWLALSGIGRLGLIQL
jgi:virginiamycin B lyase